MGCVICKGFSYQVCNAPGCQDRARSARGGLENIANVTKEGWGKLELPPPPVCDLCAKPATWAHPKGGLRCDSCDRPSK